MEGLETVTIVRRTEDSVDEYGNPEFTTSLIAVPGCFVGTAATGEPVEVSRTPIDAGLTIYFPHGTVIEPGDAFNIRGGLWDKDGDPMVWASGWPGFTPGVVLSVRRRRG